MKASCDLASRNWLYSPPQASVITLRQSHGLVHGGFAFIHGAGQVASFDAVLHSDVAGVVFAINK